MEGYAEHTYGDRVAEIYDRLYADAFDVVGTVETLVRLAGRGRALELAIGTGRIALPLSQHGIDVTGIDASQAMVAKLRSKPGGTDITVHMGDFADVDVDGTFSVIFVVFNTLFALPTQEEQVRCFANVARHLDDTGVFVIEAFVPDVTRFDRNQRVSVEDIALDEVQLDVAKHDPVGQRVDAHHVFLSSGGLRIYPIHIRYAWPSELDLMARLAGLRLRHRWAGWRGEPFDARSEGHVSVYERDAG